MLLYVTVLHCYEYAIPAVTTGLTTCLENVSFILFFIYKVFGIEPPILPEYTHPFAFLPSPLRGLETWFVMEEHNFLKYNGYAFSFNRTWLKKVRTKVKMMRPFDNTDQNTLEYIFTLLVA